MASSRKGGLLRSLCSDCGIPLDGWKECRAPVGDKKSANAGDSGEDQAAQMVRRGGKNSKQGRCQEVPAAKGGLRSLQECAERNGKLNAQERNNAGKIEHVQVRGGGEDLFSGDRGVF